MGGKTRAKQELRRSMRGILTGLDPGFFRAASAEIRTRIRLPKESRVALFAATPGEPQLLDLIIAHPEIEWFLPRVTGTGEMDFLPVSDPQKLKKGYLGIMEPTQGSPATDLDFILCPGLAFTREGLRLGQGGGFYDRALARFPKAERIGVAFSCQLVDHLPTAAHDLKMHRVITNLPAPQD